MNYFRIQQQVLCDWLWEQNSIAKAKNEIIMEKIREDYSCTEQEYQEIEKRIKKIFLPHFRRQCLKYGYRKDIMRKNAKIFMSNYFIVKFRDMNN